MIHIPNAPQLSTSPVSKTKPTDEPYCDKSSVCTKNDDSNDSKEEGWKETVKYFYPIHV